MNARPAGERADADDGAEEQSSGDDKEDARLRDCRCEEGPCDRAAAATRGNRAVESCGLRLVEDIRHEAPEDRHHEKVEYAQPHEEHERIQFDREYKQMQREE